MLGEILWDIGAPEGIIDRKHLERWSELLEPTGIGSQREPRRSRHSTWRWWYSAARRSRMHSRGTHGLQWDGAIHRVEHDMPPLLAVGSTRTLQERLELGDGEDQILFRRSGGEADLRTLES